jgi:Homeodomain-like domain/Integrase core domain
MKRENSDEIRDRHLAFRLFDKGKSPTQILRQIRRSSSWLFKWKQRFEQDGWAALASASCAPQHSPQQYSADTVQLVVRIRRRLEKAGAGLIGPRAIQQELRRHHRLRPVPSLATIKRWLRQRSPPAGPSDQAKPPYYPQPRLVDGVSFQSCDWIARYLPGGDKVFAFHTVDWQSYALHQTIRTDKSTAAACTHLLESCVAVGLPDFLQLDNDAAFTGLGYTARVFGQFVRLALYLGIELIFIPPGEADRNWLVERINGLWASSFWNKNHFPSLSAFLRKRHRFLEWYQSWAPPTLGGQTVAEATRQTRRWHLQRRQVRQLPEQVPLTAGRIHFRRRVTPQGTISLLKEDWPVSRRLAGQYVWATLDTGRKELRLYHRRSERAQARLLKCFVYAIAEPVKPLLPQYRRRARKIAAWKLL